MDAPGPHPETPPPRLRPFERLALVAGDLRTGCVALIPVVSGMIFWGFAGLVLALLAVIGSGWRVLALRGIQSSGSGGLVVRLWTALAVASALFGLAAWGGRMTGDAGALGAWTPLATTTWRCLAFAELLVATAWVARGAVERGSLWVLVPLAVATAATAASGVAQVAMERAGDDLTASPLVAAAVGLAALAGGIVAPLLVADGCGRLLQSLSSESLDEETDRASGSDLEGQD